MKTSAFVIALLSIQFATAQITPVYTIQGSGSSSSLVGSTVLTEGVVTASFQSANQLDGFFIQDTLGDGNPLTSDGIFVYAPAATLVNPGDFVVVRGAVEESFGLTRLNNIDSLTILTNNVSYVSVDISLPVTAVDDLEPFEGMYVRFPQTLYITDHYNLGRYGEISLSSGTRLPLPTNIIDPNDNPATGNSSSGSSNVGAVTAQDDLNARNQILIDDGSGVQNPNPIPYINPADSTLRTGTSTDGIMGCLSYAWSKYRLQPYPGPSFTYAPRPSVPTLGGANVKVASFNVLNYWTTLGDRGASDAAELIRQRDKLVAAIETMDADIVAIMELENNGSTALDDLLVGINAKMGSGTYEKVPFPSYVSSDAIQVGMIYKPVSVSLIDTALVSQNSIFEFPPFAQTFLAGGGVFSVFVNHFRYKGCIGATGLDLDLGDGQSCFNDRRRQQAQEVLNFISQIQTYSGDNDVLVVGDLNAYAQEDPIDILRTELDYLLPDSIHSFLYFAQWGALDHAFSTSSLTSQVTGAEVWNINADEPRIIDYNSEFITQDLYAPNPYRSSDHNPLMIGINPDPDTLPTGMGEETRFDIRYYPNPAENEVFVRTTGFPVKEIFLKDALGRVIKHSLVSHYITRLSLKDVAPGLYFIQSMGDKGKLVTIGKLIKS
ncbi:MAG: ExeM/NucH family extracellular endonuclease [Flavobacteriales bacterium]|nr:ExeM/NucH family extracellular endonuclease [Flavobacteriales bacterium]